MEANAHPRPVPVEALRPEDGGVAGVAKANPEHRAWPSGGSATAGGGGGPHNEQLDIVVKRACREAEKQRSREAEKQISMRNNRNPHGAQTDERTHQSAR